MMIFFSRGGESSGLIRQGGVTVQIIKKGILKFVNNRVTHADDDVITEEPLIIKVNGEKAYFCMRLPGMDRELAAGILYSEGLISSDLDILNIKSSDLGVVLEIAGPPPSKAKNIYSSTGAMSSAELIPPPEPAEELTISYDDLFKMKGDFLSRQKLFEITGGTHCAAIYDRTCGLLSFAEDVGRHNALDKCTGSVILSDKRNQSSIVMLSSRLSLEMVKKAHRTGVLIVAGVSAPTTAAVEAADEAGITLIGFLRDRRFNVYSRADRISGITA